MERIAGLNKPNREEPHVYKMKTEQYEWSRGGLELLSTIQNYIEQQGGIAKLYQSVVLETRKTSYQSKESLLTEDIARLRETMSRDEIMDTLLISKSKYHQLSAKLGRVVRVKKPAKPKSELRGKGTKYSSDELALLKYRCRTKTPKEIAGEMDRTELGIYCMIQKRFKSIKKPLTQLSA